MKFILSFQTKNKTFVFGNGEKNTFSIITMVTSILRKLLMIGYKKEEIISWVELADKINKEE